MFQPNWSSSGVQVVVVKESAAHCNAVFFCPIAVASGYSGYVGCIWLLLVLLGLLVVTAGFAWFAGCDCLECSCWSRMPCVGHSTNPHNQNNQRQLQ
jgi:hypothetical protein